MAPTPKEQKEWQVVYPVYLNSHRKRSEGRRIAASKGVENPTIAEIVEVCKTLGFQVLAENEKSYSKDVTQKGRVRVQLKVEGNSVNSEIKNKNQLLLKIGEVIPTLSSRKAAAQSKGAAPSKAAQPVNNNNANKAPPKPAGKKKKGKR